MPKIGILLLQMGGPCCPERVENFLYRLFADTSLIQLPKFLQRYQKALAKFIARKRSPRIIKNYQKIGERSPILFETQCQAKALEKFLGKNFKTYIAMRYSYPFLEDSFEAIQEDKLDKLFVIPLYPQYSSATSGSSINECKILFAKNPLHNCEIKYIESWHDQSDFIELISQRLSDAFKKIQAKKLTILFSAHGLPEQYIENGDPYQQQIEDSVSLVIQNFANKMKLKIYSNKLSNEELDINYLISYQSKVGPLEWLKPYTDESLIKIGKEGVKNLIIVPISFVGDHIETLEEINIQYRSLAYQYGIKNFVITRLPKANPLLIKALASLLLS